MKRIILNRLLIKKRNTGKPDENLSQLRETFVTIISPVLALLFFIGYSYRKAFLNGLYGDAIPTDITANEQWYYSVYVILKLPELIALYSYQLLLAIAVLLLGSVVCVFIWRTFVRKSKSAFEKYTGIVGLLFGSVYIILGGFIIVMIASVLGHSGGALEVEKKLKTGICVDRDGACAMLFYETDSGANLSFIWGEISLKTDSARFISACEGSYEVSLSGEIVQFLPWKPKYQQRYCAHISSFAMTMFEKLNINENK